MGENLSLGVNEVQGGRYRLLNPWDIGSNLQVQECREPFHQFSLSLPELSITPTNFYRLADTENDWRQLPQKIGGIQIKLDKNAFLALGAFFQPPSLIEMQRALEAGNLRYPQGETIFFFGIKWMFPFLKFDRIT